MNKDVTIKGFWWLPDKPENKLAGEITYGPTTGAQLSLFGYFFQDLKLEKFTLWGVTARGKPITLFDCYTKNLTMHLPGVSVAKVSSSLSVVGGHFVSSDDMEFAEVTVDLTHLRTWANISGIAVTLGDSGKGWQVTQKPLPDISLGSHEEINITLEFVGQINPRHGNISLSEDCFLTLKAKRLTPYKSFETIVRQFQHFLALGVGAPVYALSAKARIDKPACIQENQNFYEDFEIIRKISLIDMTERSLMAHDIQFCLNDLMPDASSFVNLYFKKYKLLEPVCNLYFSTLYNSSMYVSQRFLALAHAIEAYHRAFFGGKYMSNDEYQNDLQKILWNAIPDNINSDFRTSLKNKLKYMNEFSLRKRVQDICGKFEEILSPYLGKPGQFAGAVADQRNLLTHPDSTDDSRPKETDWTQIWLMSEQLSLLLEVCLLHEIGFTHEGISELLHKNRRIAAIQLNRR